MLIIKRGITVTNVLKNSNPLQIKNFNRYTKKTNDKLEELLKMIKKNNEEIKYLKEKINDIQKKNNFYII